MGKTVLASRKGGIPKRPVIRCIRHVGQAAENGFLRSLSLATSLRLLPWATTNQRKGVITVSRIGIAVTLMLSLPLSAQALASDSPDVQARASSESVQAPTAPGLSAAGFSGRPQADAPDSQLIGTFANGTKGIERLQGEAARAHFRSLAARLSVPFSAADRVLRRKGLRKSGEVVVLRSVKLDSGDLLKSEEAAAPENYTVGSPDGEMVFVSWDDGDPATWEGSIYMASYAPAGDLLTTAQFDISTATTDTVWEEVVYANPPETGPDNQMMRQSAIDGLAGVKCRPTTTRGQDSTNENPPPPPPPPAPAPKSPARQWAECSGKGCAGVAVGCLFTGFAWAPCFNSGCGAAGMICALDQILNMIP